MGVVCRGGGANDSLDIRLRRRNLVGEILGGNMWVSGRGRVIDPLALFIFYRRLDNHAGTVRCISWGLQVVEEFWGKISSVLPFFSAGLIVHAALRACRCGSKNAGAFPSSGTWSFRNPGQRAPQSGTHPFYVGKCSYFCSVIPCGSIETQQIQHNEPLSSLKY